MSPKPAPIDPLEGPQIALSGRIVSMDAGFTVIPDGVIYIDKGRIVAVQTKGQQPPAGFESVPVVRTDGTIYPGLIELHNHLSYNALPLWDVPQKFQNREQWGRLKEYRKLVSGPMVVVGRTPGLLPPLVRYVECKALVAGVTTTQGIQLASNSAVRSFYKGIVRNVESTDDPDLPEALTRIDDVEARDAGKFYARLVRSSCLLLHLSEGVDKRARDHFLALHMGRNKWAISKQLASIHCAGLHAEDFEVLNTHSGSMVWSPMSNLLLYGQTALVASAKSHGVRVGIGSDWSPTGSRNLLCELKVAHLYSKENGDFLSDRDIVRAVTSDAAAIIGWQNAIGSLEAGKRGDLMVIQGRDADAYASLIKATERDVVLVMINGVPRYGLAPIMKKLAADGEEVKIGGLSRAVYLKQKTQDPRVAAVSLKKATSMLRNAFHELPALARKLERRSERPRMKAPGFREPVEWTLALDELDETGLDVRPRLPAEGKKGFTGPNLALPGAAEPLSSIVSPIDIDPLTIVDDADYLGRIGRQRNLPPCVKQGLPTFY